jgi:hypothetical protein
MSTKTDWLPGKRVDQLALAQNWLTVMQNPGPSNPQYPHRPGAPASGDGLPHSKFTRRKRELFDFAQEDSGTRAYFCIRYENAKGDPGP